MVRAYEITHVAGRSGRCTVARISTDRPVEVTLALVDTWIHVTDAHFHTTQVKYRANARLLRFPDIIMRMFVRRQETKAELQLSAQGLLGEIKSLQPEDLPLVQLRGLVGNMPASPPDTGMSPTLCSAATQLQVSIGDSGLVLIQGSC
jgi:hypothetical protein